jgi:hypothetical protein
MSLLWAYIKNELFHFLGGDVMTNFKDNIQVIQQELKMQRDMLVLKMHLAKADIKDEWEVLEKKWERFCISSDRIKHEADDAMEDVADDLHDLGEDIREGYSRIKKALH